MESTPPALAGLPVLGNTMAFFRDPVALVRTGNRVHGPVFSLKLGPKRAAVVVGPQESRDVIALPESTLAVRPVYQWVKPMFGDVMQAAEYERYVAQRTALLPAFQGRNYTAYVESMAAEIDEWLGKLGTEGTIDAARDIEALSFRIALRLFLGADFRNRNGAEFHALFLDVAAGMELFLPANLPIPRLIRRDRARRKLFALLKPHLDAVRSDPDRERYGFLAHVVAGVDQDGHRFDDDTIMGLILILVYAAYETTAAQLAWTLILLLQNPEHLKLVEAEIDGVVGTDRQVPDLAALRRLDYLYRCQLEAHRLRPVTTMLTRETMTPFEVGGWTVPAGWQTMFCPPVTHRVPELYPEPDLFDPDRFTGSRDPGGRAAGGLLNLGGGGTAALADASPSWR
ncbi:cytochrome P450 [Phytohabitans houttuyneae]|uniref:Cytochrome P450 n=1 Tax=Phytohabitans houttuyneae TaxID=1076126 RepID=A0A6V8KLJ5_9ACTN|nr:cytochrome P450 [Phytohabitans houttuyneae]GFJ81525.1 cytochrome P450 [Phytohabitans houttuyneae]